MVSLDQMREFMEVCEAYGLTPPPLTEEVEAPPAATVEPVVGSHPAAGDLRDVVFRLRAFMETAVSGDYALGVEDGMQRAADMIERVIRTHWPDGEQSES